MKTIVVVGICLALLTFAALGKGANRERFEGEGLQITFLEEPSEYTISADAECWVRHGWGRSETYGQPGANSRFLHETGWVIVGGGYFKLFINGDEVKMNFRHYTDPLDTPGHYEMNCDWYVQFPAGYFVAGETYELTAEWGERNPRNSVQSIGVPYRVTRWLHISP
ncbi:hypothetical protein JW848_01000 [Candidatus Bipolaricaulota bacterium]|nr:hypothetical protein [Candidatus Bipolaricaulota bacterium]